MYCQELSYKQFTVKDGLPGSIVYHSLQDKNGFIWFATSQGVSRFDGNTFTNFTKEEGLPDNDILKLYLDKYNNIWCMSFVGVPAVISNGKVKRFDHCKGVIAITEDLRTDSILLISDAHSPDYHVTGYYRSHNAPGHWQFTEHLTNLHRPLNYYTTPVIRASSPPHNSFYFSFAAPQTYALNIWNDTLHKRYTFGTSVTSGLPLPFAKQSFFSLTENKKGIVFFTTDSLFYADFNRQYTIGALNRLHLVYQGNNINYLFCENDSILWVCTREQGLLRISNYLTPHAVTRSFFSNSFCTSIIKDKENGYWITTHGDGVYYLPNLSFYAITSLPNSNTKNALCIRPVNERQLCAGFADGYLIKINYNTLRSETFPGWNARNKNNRILDVWPYTNNRLLIGSDKGLYLVDASQHVQQLNKWVVKGLYVHNKGIIQGTNSTIVQLNNAGIYQHITATGRITCLTGLGQEIYWGTLQGLYTGNTDSVSFPGSRRQTLPGVIINHVDIAPDAALWVCTQQGIAIIKNGAITRLTKDQGLPGNVCKHISFDGLTAWAATSKGIARIDYHWENGHFKSTISNITEEDGLITNDVNQTAISGNFVWAATASGISCFSKNYTSHSALQPAININRITTGDSTITVTDTIQYHYRAGKLLFELSGISYRSGKQLHYEYRLNGLNSSWSSTGNHIIEFPALPFGTFTFEVRAVDRWGVKSNVPKRIVIINKSPFWKTNWFLAMTYVLLAGLLGAGFYAYNRNRQHKREQEYQVKRKLHDLEMMALRAQMNPHFIFNCLTSIQYYIIRSDIRNANTYLHKFSTLIRRTLQYSMASAITLREEINILELYLELEKLRLGDRMHYSVKIAGDMPLDELQVPTMIVQPYIENAIKHGIAPLQGRKGILSITVTTNNKYIEFTIDDNGPGIYASQAAARRNEEDHTSMGTSITERRINAINDIQKNKILLEITDKQRSASGGTGTIIKISFPIIVS
jgi:ligand-binding sensor domain-containing protein/anti-sigma regulatory factor (Ser/Thr protein kinase)